MISEVDTALRTLVRDSLQAQPDVEVVFDAPTKAWASRRNATTVSLYLYDLREDLRRRERGFRVQKEADGVPARRVPPPRWFKLSYLVTAWTSRPEDEHRLLDTVLTSFLKHESVPLHLVGGALAEPGMPVPVFVGLPPPEDRGFADVWSALGGELRPSLDVVVVAPVLTGVQLSVGPPVEPGGVELDVRDRTNGARDVTRRRHARPERADARGAAAWEDAVTPVTTAPPPPVRRPT